MSVDKHISNSGPCEVTSKYFANNTGMDESLSDFQEKKKVSVLKKNIKSNLNKPKAKKHLKRPRGQKDIRTVLQSKKNELVSYTKDFDTVCKQSGLDVDSEQLQLAIALSKSLQPTEDNDTRSTENNLQERTVRIRTTLQEYGFKVPEIKITNRNKNIKKRRKDYKLLLLTDAEKQQIISDKYSQVLFQNLDSSEHFSHKKKECSNNNAKLYYLTTNAAYELIKNNDPFYVNNLQIEKSSNKGCLLRDWGEIPGRPLSPKPSKKYTMDLSEIACSQDELDVILSGTLKCAKNITKDKIKKVLSFTCNMLLNDNAKSDSDMNVGIDVEDKDGGIRSETIKKDIEIGDPNLEDTGKNDSQIKFQGFCSKSSSSDIARSGSPDLFDDECPSMFNNTEVVIKSTEIISVSKLDTVPLQEAVGYKRKSDDICEILPHSSHSQEFSSVEIKHKDDLKFKTHINVTKRRSNDIMEITECIATSVRHPLFPRNLSISGVEYNATKMKSNDFMDLTECVPHSSHKSFQKMVTDNNIDLTQKSDNDDLTIVQEEPEQIQTEKSYEHKIESMDLTQSSNSTDDLPFIQVSGTNKSLENTVILNDSDLIIINKLPKKRTLERDIINNEGDNEDLLDLTAEILQKNKENINSSSSSSFDEFLYDHSNKIEDNDEKAENSENMSSPYKNNEKYEIDLTQNTSSSEEVFPTNSNNSVTDVHKIYSCMKSSLGKIDDISIDYDEVICNMNQSMSNSNNVNVANSYDLTDNNDEKQLETSIQSSQECEAFEISDKELDYSLHKSYFEQPEIHFGGISIMDDISHIQTVDSNETVTNHHNRSSFLPPVDIKSSNSSQPSNSEIETPCKENDVFGKLNTPSNRKHLIKTDKVTPISDFFSAVKTPSNGKYLIKTEEVTPMSDFSSMSTPERNQELDRYGLKPLKRKRAIQLLTHIYNQTHPILETCSNNELQSPSKKQKRGPPMSKSPKKVRSPRKKNGTEQLDGVKENIYETTNEMVDVRDIECCAEDWIFQKREKAKVHSCRVPLHIAFHNYVSCRRWLREAILRYEPINIDVVHKDLVANGFKYDPKDLLKFLDKKCITVKTTDNSLKNNRR